ncbi:Chromosomal replication initiator protein DnaA [Buchnera aphidicola (Eriosoma lanigerum)]
MSVLFWQYFLNTLQNKLSSVEFSMWIRPLRAQLLNNTLELYAPNQFVLDWIKNKYINNFNELISNYFGSNPPVLKLKIKTDYLIPNELKIQQIQKQKKCLINKINSFSQQWNFFYHSYINKKYNFENFVEGKSNQLARSIAYKIANNNGKNYNPLFLYGKTGLGKTHLLHAVGNTIILNQRNAKVICINSEFFIQNILYALKYNIINELKAYCHSIDFFLIDDFHYFLDIEQFKKKCISTFYSLIKDTQKIILTSNRYLKETLDAKFFFDSKFKLGIEITINPPELNTRVSILIKKAHENNVSLSKDVAYFIAKKIYTNIRELKETFNKIMLSSYYNQRNITLNLVKKIIHNTFNKKNQIITINYIQKVVAKYYKIQIIDLLSYNRSRSIVRSRQIAMTISKKLTNYSLSEIGKAFGGRNHTTVLHACKTIKTLIQEKNQMKHDFLNLIQTISI